MDLDQDNIGKTFYNILIEDQSRTQEAVDWCDMIFATGSTLINNTISTFVEADKPSIFYGVTISAPASILGLNTFCQKGR